MQLHFLSTFIVAISFWPTPVTSTFDLDACTECVDRADDCIYCGVGSIWSEPADASICHCGNFTGLLGHCSDFNTWANEFETNEDCVEFDDVTADDLVDAIAGGFKVARNVLIIIVVVVVAAILACVACCIFCCNRNKAAGLQQNTAALNHQVQQAKYSAPAAPYHHHQALSKQTYGNDTTAPMAAASMLEDEVDA